MGETKIWPKSATRKRGLGVFFNGEGLPTIVCVNGIGEANNETDDPYKYGPADAAGKKPITYHSKGIQKNVQWGGWTNLLQWANKLGWNIIFTNSSSGETTDEIDYAIEVAKNELKAPAVGFTGLSWGGYRFRLWCNRNPTKIKELAVALIVAPGQGDAEQGQNIARAELPTWWHHAERDSVVGPKYSIRPFVAAKQLDPEAPVYYTEWAPDENATDDHNIYGMVTTLHEPKMKRDASAEGVSFSLTVFPIYKPCEWMDKILRGQKVSPEGKNLEPVEIPKPSPVPGPVPTDPLPTPNPPATTDPVVIPPTEPAKPKIIARMNVSSSEKAIGVDITYKDGTTERVKIQDTTGDLDKIKNLWFNFDDKYISVTTEKETSVPVIPIP